VTTEPSLFVYPEGTLGSVLGFEHLSVAEDRATACFEVETKHKQPFGLVHGGVYAALAEGLTSEATARAVGPDGMVAQGMANNLSFLRPVFEGTVHAEAIRRHRGRTTWVWDVDMTDQEGHLCATSRVTVAVRPMTPEMKAAFGLS
jgi:1,4-dihydroxy-2-naphthoyl-CoA hydrolase